MNFDLFFGLPNQRIIRSGELVAYHKYELGRPKFARAKSPGDFPAPLQQVINALQAERPNTPGDGMLGPGEARYALHKTAFTVTVALDKGELFLNDPSRLTLANETLYCNVTGGGWLCAMKPKEDAKEIAAFTSERCILKYVAQADRALLLDKNWFIKGRFFCIAPEPGQFMQILNRGDGYVIEFRAGSSRPVNRTYESDFARIDNFLEDYLSGRNINSGEYRFAPFTGPDPIPEMFPGRDQEGRWLAQRESILATTTA